LRAADVPVVTIVGGGFSGASLAVQLARHSALPLDVTVVEPRAAVGRGLAYSTDDPDHRLKGTVGTHLVDPADPEELTRWCAEQAIARDDPDAVAAGGALFVRRHEFGRFVGEAFAREARRDGRVRLRHLRDEAIDARPEEQRIAVTTRGHACLPSDLLVIATGNVPTRFPARVAPDVDGHPGLIGEPWDLGRIRAIDRDARVFVLGTGLTALDVVTTLLRAGHRGSITAVSSRALRPRPHRPAFDVPPAPSGAGMLQRIDGHLPEFLRVLPRPLAAPALTRALRRRIAQAREHGESWYGPFDELRDPLWQLWSELEIVEKRRVLRHVRRWYDVHRFRAPPQNEAIVHDAERQGQVVFRAAKVRSIEAGDGGALAVELHEGSTGAVRLETFDAVVNCAGLDSGGGAMRNPFLAALMQQGTLAPHAAGVGFAVDARCRPIGANGAPSDAVRVIGPPTAGAFGDPLGAIFIAAQIRRMLPGVYASLGKRAIRVGAG
jgi:uncharacterized NAD(P)/FAD-binding protein YdhS